ncbi:MAG TPA: class D sortase [Candidatus Cybelea sp.]|nr:class D sortase [Candidatus Cybelea sp.]
MTAHDLDDLFAFLTVGAKRVNGRLPFWLRGVSGRAIDASARGPSANLEAEFVNSARAAWSAFCRLAEVAAELACTYSRATAFAVASALVAASVNVLAKTAPFRSRALCSARSLLESLSRPMAVPPLRRRAKQVLRTAEIVLGIVAVVMLGYCAYVYTSAAAYQAGETHLFNPSSAKPLAQKAAGVGMTIAAPVMRQVLGMLEIPRIGLISFVEQGDDSKILNRSIGHIPGTALPGSEGNVGLAGHRDSFFRDLGQLVPGDEIVFRMTSTTYKYKVRSTSIVDPTDVGVLAPTGRPILTLVTCYPFDYVGSAPRRFILVADQFSAGN